MQRFASGLWAAGFLCFAILSASLFSPGVAAREAFEAFSTDITLYKDAPATISHDITVMAEGDQIKRGIFLVLPGSIGPVENIRVTRNGQPEPFTLDDRELRIFDPEVLLPAGRHRYRVDYEAPRPFAISGDTLRFSWRPILWDSELPWSDVAIEVTWSFEATPEISAPFGGAVRSGKSLRWTPTGDQIKKRLTLTWPASLLPAGSRIEPRQVENTNLRFGAPALAAFIVWLVHSIWRRHGKVPPMRPSGQRSAPPRGLSAAATRYVARMHYDAQCLLAAMVSLVVKGAMSIDPVEAGKFRLTRTNASSADLFAGEQALLAAIFKKKEERVLGQRTGTWLALALNDHQKAITGEFKKRFFRDNFGPWSRGFGLALAAGSLVIFLLVREIRLSQPDELAIVLGAMSLVVIFLAPLIYLITMRSPTEAGRVIMEEINGFTDYLQANEKLSGAEGMAEQFVSYLPYAVAHDLEAEWQARFYKENLDRTEDTNIRALIDWYETMKTDGDDATLAAVLLPTVNTSSGASSAAGSSGGGGGGGSAGGI